VELKGHGADFSEEDLMNMGDYRNIEGDKIVFVRSKTENSTHEQKLITVFLNNYTKEVIN
jgi:hypothetical protein